MDSPTWLRKSMQLDAAAEQMNDAWFAQVDDRLATLWQKPKLKEALDCLVNEISANSLTEIELFEQIDANGDGELSKGELSTSLRKLGVTVTTTEMDAIIRVFDTDGNGTIDFSEFYYLLKKHKSPFATDGEEVEGERYDPLHGFGINEKLKCLVQISNQQLGVDPYEKVSPFVKVIGPGRRRGIILVQFDTKARACFGVRADQLARPGEPRPPPTPLRKEIKM
eukprot:TRINITY_DN74041_c0_g1_i1.p1 TRINITY_DN74041_c0_g1~~TRINITY_DN74041_c0_g1_i1.p1  ORF type:complete len:224 (+),score=46.68 TRINITY_DN74041_c0_g1_i1:63-734(+)